MYLSKDDILKADDLPTQDVEVPEWGGTVRVARLSGTLRDEWDKSRLERQADGSLTVGVGSTAKLVALSIVDENGEPMFTALEVGLLGKKSGQALARVFQAAVQLNALNGEQDGELEGNSEAAPSGDSGSTSPES